jgi:hypothetical protein
MIKFDLENVLFHQTKHIENCKMPNKSPNPRCLSKRGRSGLTHQEVMARRYAKKKKRETKGIKAKKMDALKEYQRLSKMEHVSKKNTAKDIMEVVEEVKDEGMNDNRYLIIMDHLMALFNEEEQQPIRPPRRTRIWNLDYGDYNYNNNNNNNNNNINIDMRYINYINDIIINEAQNITGNPENP